MKFKTLMVCVVYCLHINIAIAIPNSCIPDLSKAPPHKTAEFIVEYVNKVAPNSSTRNLLRKPGKIKYVQGKPISDEPIAETIRQYRKEIEEKILENYAEYDTPENN